MMRKSSKLGAAVILVALALVLCFWSMDREQHLIADALAVEAPATQTPAATLQDTSIGPTDGSRNAVGEAPAEQEPSLVVEPGLIHPFLYVLAVRVLDENGLPAHDVQVRLAPARSSLNQAQTNVEAFGWATFWWGGKQPEMEVDLQINGSGSLTGSRRFRVRGGTSTEVAALCKTGAAPVFHVEIQGEADAVLTGNAHKVVLARFRTLRGLALEQASADDLRMFRFPHPHARFGDRFVAVAEPPSSDLQQRVEVLWPDGMNASRWEVASRDLDRRNLAQALTILTRLRVVADLSAASPETSRVTVRVLDDRGEALPECLVALGRGLDETELSEVSDEQGQAVFDAVEGGWWEARAGGGSGGLARERLFVTAPNPLHWDARLDRGARIIGRVFDAEGKPLSGYLVHYESVPDCVPRGTSVRVARETLGGEEISERTESALPSRSELRAPWVDATTVNEDGSFELANLPAGLGRLLVLAPGDEDGPALFVEENVLPGEHEYMLRLPAAVCSLRAQIQLPEPWRNEPVELRAISESTGRGVCFVRGEDGYRCAYLSPGWYRVELGAGVLGWHDLGRHYVDAGAQVEIGEFSPPPPGKVRVLLPEHAKDGTPALGLAFYLRRSDIDIRGEPGALDGNKTLNLPAGEYRAFWTAADGSTRHRALTLEAGATADLDLRDSR